jgi:hypothetical protein
MTMIHRLDSPSLLYRPLIRGKFSAVVPVPLSTHTHSTPPTTTTADRQEW